MILHLTKDTLEWQEIHHEQFARLDTIMSVFQAEVFYYNNDQITVRSTIKIIEHSNRNKNFELVTNSYSHVHPELIRLEFTDGKQLGEYETLDEAKFAAQTHFNHHNHVKYNHSH